MSFYAALLTFAGTLGMSEGGRKYAFSVSVSSQGSGDRERQVSDRNRKYMKFLYKI